VSQDSVDDWRICDETDDFHHTLTLAADERIHSENLFDQPGPVFPALLAKLPVFAIRPGIVWLESTSGHTLSTALGHPGEKMLHETLRQTFLLVPAAEEKTAK
jgi:hypothetical protein